MSNVEYYINAIRQQTEKVTKLTFKDLIEANFQNQTDQDIEEAWKAYKHNYIYRK